jgi:hypothetical protein
MNLPPFPSIPQSPEERLRWVQWGEQIRAMERERCATVCDDYSKHLIASGVNEWNEFRAHGAEECSNLLKGLNEYGDPPESGHFAGSYAAIRAAIDAASSGGKGDGE